MGAPKPSVSAQGAATKTRQDAASFPDSGPAKTASRQAIVVGSGTGAGVPRFTRL
jgi:hypothetical protein